MTCRLATETPTTAHVGTCHIFRRRRPTCREPTGAHGGGAHRPEQNPKLQKKNVGQNKALPKEAEEHHTLERSRYVL